MSLYHVVFALLLCGTLAEYFLKRTPRKLYIISFVVLAAFTCLRYGQGSDYFSYAEIYALMPLDDLKYAFSYLYHTETGWKVLCLLFRWVGAPFEVFMFCISAFLMWMLWRFVERFTQCKIRALLLSYHTLILTYVFSGTRQAFVMLVFLGVMLPWLLDKKYIRYILGILVCVNIHSSTWLLLAPLVLYIPFMRKISVQLVLAAMAWGVGLLIGTGIVMEPLMKILPETIVFYFENSETGISAIAALERLASYGVAVVVYLYYKKHEEADQRLDYLMGITTLGMIVYGGFLWLPLMASRMGFMLKIAEMAILCLALPKSKWIRAGLVLYCCLLCSALYVKNISSYIWQGPYFDSVNVWNFPYVSVFNKETINAVRDVSMWRWPIQ